MMHVEQVAPILNVSDVEASFAWSAKPEPWGVRELRVRHPDGYVFRIGQAIGDG